MKRQWKWKKETSTRYGKIQYKETITITLVNFTLQQQRDPHFSADRFHKEIEKACQLYIFAETMDNMNEWVNEWMNENENKRLVTYFPGAINFSIGSDRKLYQWNYMLQNFTAFYKSVYLSVTNASSNWWSYIIKYERQLDVTIFERDKSSFVDKRLYVATLSFSQSFSLSLFHDALLFKINEQI
jgi:hypothetical protein